MPIVITQRVAEYGLTMEENFSKNPHTMRKGDTTVFEWFNKCGGENAGLDVIIHLKNSMGNIVNNFSEMFPLHTELVYNDGSSTPLMPLCPLKERKTSSQSRLPLYRPMRPEPILHPGQASHDFTFRVEEVSFHHPGHNGFKLKVSPKNNEQRPLVVPGILEETIKVRSKPKTEPSGKKLGGRKTVPMKDPSHQQQRVSKDLTHFNEDGTMAVLEPGQISEMFSTES
eukprot:8885459-Ditylum_brightwellii.AAC.1